MSRQNRGYIFPIGKIIDGNLFCFCKFPDRVKPLGLRKASATILAGAGATEHQLMAIFGWSDSKMALHYTKAAQSKGIIDAGFERRKTYVARKNVPLSSSR
ncbi:hypothetical protein [Rhizobium sullae]|uniref:hypothetical protein n=1 Tax=Rhizobium sullae TaxID=50338 RepID=UPI00269B6DB6